MTDAAIRCFVAVELPGAVKQALANVQQGLQVRLGRSLGAPAQQSVRWVAPESIHLTLKFLGNVPADQLAAIQSALRDALQGAHSCTVTVGGLGMFPGQSRPRVIWVGVGGDLDQLGEIQGRVEAATVPLGFPSEQRAFSPHLTLARVREETGPADRRTLGALVAAERFDVQLAVPVREVSLVRSELGRGGARYSRIAAVPLAT